MMSSSSDEICSDNIIKSGGLFSFSARVFKAQHNLALSLLADRRCRGPLLVIWLASFGGALHAPVTTFYLLEVGATSMDVGWLGFFQACGSLVCGPIYGWLLDHHGAFLAMSLAAFMCTAGCLIRGLATDISMVYIGYAVLGLGAANLWTTVLSYLASITDPSQRQIVVSGYLFQTTTLQILGKALYPLVDWVYRDIFGVTRTLPRMRLHMAECTLFCFVAFSYLVARNGDVAVNTKTEKYFNADNDDGKENLISGDTPEDRERGKDVIKDDEMTPGLDCPTRSIARFCGLSLVLVIQSFSNAATQVLWPLYLNDTFQWTANEFAYFLFISSVICTAMIAAAPIVEHTIGRVASQIIASTLAAVAAVFCFQFTTFGLIPIGLHITLTIALLGALSFMEPGLKAMSSQALPSRLQGTAFGILNSLSGIGSMIGNPAATWLYGLYSKEELYFFGNPHALPMIIVCFVLLSGSMLLALLRDKGCAGDVGSYCPGGLSVRVP
eukprot:m.90601 g.90601  ORF g.90601 m.90601 type:complete len:498 (-) comp13274_c0_seq4:45-1538(-)